MELTTKDKVATYLGLGTRDVEGLEAVVTAVNGLVSDWLGYHEPAAEVKPQHAHGATMLAARVFRRRNSPAGVEALGDLGPVYVSRNDPDLAMMLGLANYRRPVVG